jgi:hypothetical protein
LHFARETVLSRWVQGHTSSFRRYSTRWFHTVVRKRNNPNQLNNKAAGSTETFTLLAVPRPLDGRRSCSFQSVHSFGTQTCRASAWNFYLCCPSLDQDIYRTYVKARARYSSVYAYIHLKSLHVILAERGRQALFLPTLEHTLTSAGCLATHAHTPEDDPFPPYSSFKFSKIR